MLSNFNYRPGVREVRSTPISVAGAFGPGHCPSPTNITLYQIFGFPQEYKRGFTTNEVAVILVGDVFIFIWKPNLFPVFSQLVSASTRPWLEPRRRYHYQTRGSLRDQKPCIPHGFPLSHLDMEIERALTTHRQVRRTEPGTP